MVYEITYMFYDGMGTDIDFEIASEENLEEVLEDIKWNRGVTSIIKIRKIDIKQFKTLKTKRRYKLYKA